MQKKERITAVIAEKDAAVAAAARRILEARSYEITAATSRRGLTDLLGTSGFRIAVVGDVEGSESPFVSLREAVMVSPMTSVILITSAPAREVEEKAEGYGILGHVGRDVRAGDLEVLLDNFEKIQRELGNS